MPQVTTITKQPGDQVDLLHSLSTDGTTDNQNQDVRCFVTNPSGTAISGSPFTLTHEARGSYVKRAAYTTTQAGTYREEYIVYTTYPNDENLRYGRGIREVDCRYEGSANIGGVDAGFAKSLEVALVKLRENIPELVWRYDLSGIKNPKAAALILKNWITEGKATPQDLQPILEAVNRVPSQIIIPPLEPVQTTLRELYQRMVDMGRETAALQTEMTAMREKIGTVKIPDHGKMINALEGSVKKLAEKNTQVVVDIEQFLQGVQKANQQATRQIVNQLARKIDQRTDNRDVLQLLSAIAEKKPDYSEVIGYLQALNDQERERLGYAVRLLAGIIKQGAKIKIDLQQTLTDKRRAYAMAGNPAHNFLPTAA